MKKVLYTTTALVAAGMISAHAQAADPIKIGVSGFLDEHIGYADQDNFGGGTKATDYKEVDVKSDVEVHFTGSTKLDNGITVSVKIELEADDTAAGSDLFALSLSSETFGTVILGEEVTALDMISIAAPHKGYALVDADDWIVMPTGFTAGGRSDDFASDGQVDDGEGDGITYLSPTFAGFTVGASYLPDMATKTDTQPANTSNGVWGAGVAYGADFDGVAVKAQLGYGNAGNLGNLLQSGASVSMAGFTVSGGWHKISASQQSNGNTTPNDATDASGYEVGVAYETGPYAVSLSYAHSEGDKTNNTKDEGTVWGVGGQYAMGPGVTLEGTILNVDWDGGNNATTADNNSGWAAIAGVRVAF
ncbi:porin [Magnetospira thiophila]